MGPRSTKALHLSLLLVLAFLLVPYCFRGGPSPCDGVMHLSKINIMLENLGKSGSFPRWNPYWYFGIPMWRIYSPLSYYMMSVIGWIFNLALLEIVKLWGYLVFCISAVSTYLLAQEIRLKRLGRLASGFLFLTSFNLIAYWGIGSYPNITGIAFSPLAMSLFIRASRKRTLPSILVAGLAFSAVLLIYFMHAIMTMVFMAVISVVMTLREPSLLFVSRGPTQAPRYTLALPRILFLIILIAGCLSMWWTLPFLTTYLSAPVIPGESGYGVPGPLVDQVISLVGIYMSIDSPGLGHFILAVIGCLIVFVKLRERHLEAGVCFVVAFILCLSPWLSIPTGPLFWWRFTLYLSLFASVCGGIALDSIKDFYQKLWDQSPDRSPDRSSSGKLFLVTLILLILVVSVYPVLSSAQIVFHGLDMSERPGYIDFLEDAYNAGERIAIDEGYDLNVYSSIPQSGGGNVHYAYMVNQFAYTFWFYVISQKDYTFLPYFARSFNVRWVRGVEVDGANEVHPGIYEVKGSSSSFAEVIGRETAVALFIGDISEYSNLFTSIAMANPCDIIPVYGGAILEDFDLETLRKFDVVYLHGLRCDTEESLRRVSTLLSDYVGEGGGLILDTGDITYGQLSNIPEPFPVSSTDIFADSHLDLKQATPHEIAEDLDLTRFSSRRAYATSFAVSVRDESVHLIQDGDRPAVVFWPWGGGRVMWTGLRLPYLTMLCEEEEVAKLLVNMLRFAASAESETAGEFRGHTRAEFPSLDEIVVEVKNASFGDALWVKMTYYPGWTAEIAGEKAAQRRIFHAGPNMIMIFPERKGDFRVKFVFAKDMDVQIGEAISTASAAAILILASFCYIREIWMIPKGWAKTHHTGSGLPRMKK